MNKIEKSCRICMKSKEDLQPIKTTEQKCFYAVTQTKLIKLEHCSNSICSECCGSLKQAFDYRNDLIKVQEKIFNEFKSISGEDPMEITSSSIDPNTVLLFIKQEQDMEVPLNPFNFSLVEDEGDNLEYEIRSDLHRTKIKNKRNKHKKKKECTRNEIETIHCKYCDKPINKYYYKKHLERVHFSSKFLICDICNHQSHFKASLEIHMTRHFGIKPFRCTIEACGMKFRAKKDLRLHIHSEHPNSANKCELFICETCGKSFRFKKSMEIHVRSNHTFERPFKCDIVGCNSAYFCNTNLMTHKKRSHSFEIVTCEVCGKTFNSLINLNEHVRKNHKEGQHICPAEGCGRRFITPYYLNLHAKTHYGIRDRECQWCGQRFFNKKHLNQHVEVAHKKSRFYCQVPACTSVFSRKCNIREHVKKIHRELTEETKQMLLSEITKMKPIYMVNQGKEETPL